MRTLRNTHKPGMTWHSKCCLQFFILFSIEIPAMLTTQVPCGEERVATILNCQLSSMNSKKETSLFARFLPVRDYVTFGFLLSQIRLSSVCLSSVTFVRPTQGVETFCNISSAFCTLSSILWLPCKILRRSSQGNLSIGGIKHISPERCGSVSLWCSTPGPYHTSPVQPPLASGAADDLFQDRGPCMEIYQWCRSRLSTGSMLTSGECPRSSSSTVCIDWMCGAAKSVDVNRASGASASTVPQCGTVCRLLCATTVFHWTRFRGSWRIICLDSNAHHPAPLRRFVTLAPSINVMTYLLTYLLNSFPPYTSHHRHSRLDFFG